MPRITERDYKDVREVTEFERIIKRRFDTYAVAERDDLDRRKLRLAKLALRGYDRYGNV